ncbi:MAG: hypothetical protein ABI577_02180 [bacterium]
MFSKVVMAVAFVLITGLAAVGLGGDTAFAESGPPGPAKILVLNPTSGVVGTVVTGDLTNAPPNDFITAIFKIPGDPVLATGTSDANGHLVLTFTIPYVPGGGTYPVFFTDFKCSCQVAADFTVINSRPTPTPTATATIPPSATPTKSPTVPATVPATATAPAATATATPTPGVPVLGTSAPGGPPGPNVGILALGMLAVLTVLSWFAATRRGTNRPALAYVEPPDFDFDYSTELDIASLDLLRRPARPSVTAPRTSGRGVSWAIGAGFAAVAGFVLLRRR